MCCTQLVADNRVLVWEVVSITQLLAFSLRWCKQCVAMYDHEHVADAAGGRLTRNAATQQTEGRQHVMVMKIRCYVF